MSPPNPAELKSCGRQTAGKSNGYGRRGWKAAEARGRETRKYGLTYQSHSRTTCVYVVTPVSLHARNCTHRGACFRLEGPGSQPCKV